MNFPSAGPSTSASTSQSPFCEASNPPSPQPFASSLFSAPSRPVNRRLWTGHWQRLAFEPALPRLLREQIEDHKNRLRAGDCSPSRLDQYVEKHISLIASEFEMPGTIEDQTTLSRWKKLLAALGSEYADGARETGCGLIYYLTALSAFLQSPRFLNYRSRLDSERSEVLNTAVQRLRAQLPGLLRVAALINGLKLIPSPETKDLPSLIFLQIKDNMRILMGQGKEFVIPLGWMLPAPHGGHLILSRLSRIAQGQTRITLFNPTPVDGFLTGTIPTSFSLVKESDPETVLKDCCSILPFQIPQNLTARLKPGYSELSAEQVKETALKVTKATYQILGNGARPPCRNQSSVLDSMRFNAGKNCVPAAFRMLLYTMVKEEAAKLHVGASCQGALRDDIESFFQHFYGFVREKLSFLTKSDR